MKRIIYQMTHSMRYIALLCLTALLAVSCKDPFINQTYVEKTDIDLELSNAAYLKKNADQFSLWIELLKHADLFNALNDASSKSTVFAPTNEAMEQFLAWKGVETVQQLDKQYARYVAQVHILDYSLVESSFISYIENGGQLPIKTLFGNYLPISYGYRDVDVDDVELVNVQTEDTLHIYLNNQAKVEKLATTTANGQVYTLGGVIHPLSETILEILDLYKGDDENTYSLFIEAARRSGFDKVAAVYADTIQNLDGTLSINEVRYTCFAVPDARYKAKGIQSVDALESYLKTCPAYGGCVSDSILYQYMMYHFVNQIYTKDNLEAFQDSGQVLIFDTQLPGQVFVTQQTPEGATLINEEASLIRTGIKARNGIIHKISDVMPVFEPEPVTLRWDFCASPDIISCVNTYGATRNLGDLYSTPLTNKDYQVDLSEERIDGNVGTISSFTYKATATKTPSKTCRRVGFYKCPYMSRLDQKNNLYGAYNNNLMTINLGYAGWFQMNTPTIIKGKYKVVFHYAGDILFNKYYASGSLTKFNLDDYQKSAYLWKGLPGTFEKEEYRKDKSASGLVAETLWEVVEFDGSGSHTFKVTLMDINAKTTKNYYQLWDYLEFIPIND